MKTAILRGREIADKGALHSLLARQLDFPDYYGGNLDALYDLLTETAEPIRIVIADPEALAENLGGYYDVFRAVLRDAGEDNGNVTVSLETLDSPDEA